MQKEIEEIINHFSNQEDTTFAYADAPEQEIEAWKNILEGINFYGNENLRNELKAIENKVEIEGFLLTDDDLEAYFLQHKKSSKANLIEKRIKNDVSFAKEMSNMEDLILGVQWSGEDKMKEDLKNITRSESDNKKTFKVFYLQKKHWAMAASFVGVAFLTWFLMSKPKQNDIVAPTPVQPILSQKDTSKTETVLTNKPITPKIEKTDNINLKNTQIEEKYADYIAFAEENYDLKSSMLFSAERNSNADSEQILIDSTLILMQKKQYQNALFLLEKNVFSSQYEAKISAIKAHLYFSLKKNDLAISQFKAIVDNPKSVYQEESEYYLLLCYLVDYQRNKNNFQDLSTKISNDKEHSFYEKTINLIGTSSRF